MLFTAFGAVWRTAGKLSAPRLTLGLLLLCLLRLHANVTLVAIDHVARLVLAPALTADHVLRRVLSLLADVAFVTV